MHKPQSSHLQPWSQATRRNDIATWLYGKLSVRQRVCIDFSISSLHFPLSVFSAQFYFHLFIYLSFSFLRLTLFFLFPSFFRTFCLLSFLLHFFLPTYYVYLLSFTLPVPSFLSSLLFIYSFTVMSNARAEMFKLQSL
jgi:hypothetical protein